MRRYMSGVAIAFVLLGMSSDAHAVEPPATEEILSAWQQRATRFRIEWRYELDGGIDRYSRFLQTSSPRSTTTARPNRLEVDGDRFRYSGLRRVVGEHGYHPEEVTSVTFTLSEFFPERRLSAFEHGLGTRFAEHTHPVTPVQSFGRTFDGSQLRDYWEPDRDQYPRATLHQLPEPGSAAWAELSLDETTYELESLDSCAALIALSPGHRLFDINADRCQVQRQPVIVAGSSCWMMTETPTSDTSISRTYWVDPDRGCVVRRFLGKSPDRQVQIDIDYQHIESDGWMPQHWIVLLKEGKQEPVQHFVRSEVTTVEPAQPLTEEDLTIDFPVGTWVVDQPAAEQYLVLTDGQRRVIEWEEFRWLPTYDELRATGTGQVSVLIEEKIERRRFWREAKWPLLIGIVALVGALLFKVLKRKRRQSTAIPPETVPS